MHDLRRQALESGKTVSKKAQSRLSSNVSSRGPSAANSRSASRVVSRAGSDDEETENISDESMSVTSIDDILAADESELSTETWTSNLTDRTEEIIDRKRSSVQGRELALAIYVKILTHRFAEEQIEGKEMQLVGAFLKSIKAEASEKEVILALKALAMTVVTSPSDSIYETAAPFLRRTISDSAFIPVKSAAIHTLGVCTFYGGASDEEILENMAFFLEIVSSDGNFIEAADEPDPVRTALEEWGFLATQIEDLSEESEDFMEVFIDQLESSEPSVQIAAGENIALLFEKSFTPPEDSEIISDSDTEVQDDDEYSSGPKLIKRYDAYRRTDQLIHTLTGLARLSSRSLSKKDKKSLHSNFSDILNSVENPTRGPKYQNAINQDTGRRYGNRMNVRIHKDGIMRIDKWWKLLRLQGLKRVLQGGFVTHYENNGVVFESLPIMIETEKKSKKSTKTHLTVPRR